MWQKILMLCLFAALPWQGAAAIADASDATASRRSALVIGNGAYPQAPLLAPANDAQAVAERLRGLGFAVDHVDNASRPRMQQAIRDFAQRLAGGGVGLFYFAGHGFQLAGRTWLLPVDGEAIDLQSVVDDMAGQSHEYRSDFLLPLYVPKGRYPLGQGGGREEDGSENERFRAPLVPVLTHPHPGPPLDGEGVGIHATTLDAMATPRPDRLNLVILDTCLDQAVATGGPAPALPAQTLIAYATAPGAAAMEGDKHGLFTAAFLNAMAGAERANVADIFRHAQAAVAQSSGQRQIPWLASSLPADFIFPGNWPSTLGPAVVSMVAAIPSLAANVEAGTPSGRSRGILPKDSAEQYEITFWESIKDSSHASDYEAYLQAYPSGRFATLAKTRIERLRAQAPKAATAPEKAPAAPPTPKAVPTPAPPVKAAPAPIPAAPAPPPPSGKTSLAAIKEIKDCPTCPVMLGLPAGSFTMGSNTDDPSEKPAHQVSIGAAFAIGKFEVTVEQWNACAATDTCPRIATMAGAANTAPARDISWDDAQLYVKWLSKLSGKSYRLPSEAEWEYAARGGTTTRYWWGDQMRTGNANCKGCGEPWQQGGPANVGAFAANPYGLHDVNGGIWEWVADCWHNNYQGAPINGQVRDTPNCRVRVIRGGSWRDGPSYMLSSTRFKYDASIRHSQNGFRVARELP